ncbi:MAG TPA: thioesterase family protein [Steroidobacteraceae bacterium]|nr:thioesterase family protein [Steroidobacteraceae bacterium]
MAGISIYETPVLPEWIDYNGHVRDAYYGVIASSACDALMDRLGVDAAYRARTHCTLYTLEMHVHFLNEVKSTGRVAVAVSVLGADAKRLHAGFTLTSAPTATVAATVEMMLLHVQQGAKPASTPFPSEVAARIAALSAAAPAAGFGPGSRALALRPAARGA